MTDPQRLQDDASHVLLHAWATLYLSGGTAGVGNDLTAISTRLEAQAAKLRESAAQLAAALEKMRIANAKLAARMAEHKAFFAKYQAPE